MTRPALVISPVFGIETVAAILDSREIRRLPVVRDGQLVGIVSRGDLVRALAGSAQSPSAESLVSDATPQAPASVALGGSSAANNRVSKRGKHRLGRARQP